MKFLAVRAHEKSLELVYRVAPDVPRRVVGDSTRLRQVLVNLVGNAIKFTQRGEVMLDVIRLPRVEDRRAWIELRVTDTGIGIAETKLSAIFEAFEQADSSTTRQFGGTGLGLAITHKLAELMGGTISVESHEGRGSCFRVSLPFKLVDEEQRDEVAPPVGAISVLVVDDNESNRGVLLETLASWNVAASGAANAEEALVASAPRRKRIPFDVVRSTRRCPIPTDSACRADDCDGRLVGHVVMMLTSKDRPGDIAGVRDGGPPI